jgi:serine/threonine-protein kinase
VGAAAAEPAHPVTAELGVVGAREDDDARPLPAPPEEDTGRRSPWAWLLPLMLVLALAAGLVWFFFLRDAEPVSREPSPTGTVSTSAVPGTPSPSPTPTQAEATAETVEVLAARYEGRPVDDVVQELSDLGFAVQREGRTSDEPVDTVLSLNPVGQVARGATVTVVHSTGPDTVTLPSGMVGRQAQPLIDEITALGVNITLYEEPTEDAEPGTVLRTEPIGGSTVRPGDTIQMWVAAERTAEPTPTPAPTEEPTSAPATTTPTPTAERTTPAAEPTPTAQGG